MKVCFLLPLFSIEDLKQFEGLPAASLLGSANIPALLAEEVVLCAIAPSTLRQEIEQSARIIALARYCDFHFVEIDDLLVDRVFEVMPSLSYLRGISERQSALPDTCFIFLSPDMIFSNGAVGALARKMREADVVYATCLRVERDRFCGAVGGAESFQVSPRELVRGAIPCLDLEDLSAAASSEFLLGSLSTRRIWKQDDLTLLVYDLAPMLLALKPSRVPAPACGFRDFSFAEHMCPGGSHHYFTDSDEFCAVKVRDELRLEELSLRSDISDGIDTLLLYASPSQVASAIRHPCIFHGAEIPSDPFQTNSVARAMVKLARSLSGDAFSNTSIRARYWQLALYLWSVRRFEMGRAPLPPAPMENLLSPLAMARSPGRAGFLGVVRLMARLVRALRRIAAGYVPIVGLFHPEWPEYRAAMPTLRSALRAAKGRRLYIGSGRTVLSRVLGPPALAGGDLLAGVVDPDRQNQRALDFALIELSRAEISNWATIVELTLPLLSPRGQILVFYLNDKRGRGAEWDKQLALGCAKLQRLSMVRSSVSTARAGTIAIWVRSGYPIVRSYLQRRDLRGVVTAGGLLLLLSALSMARNLLSLFGGTKDAKGILSSVTVVIDRRKK